MSAGQGQAQLTIDGSDISGAVGTLDVNGQVVIPFDSTSTPLGGHVISSRFIPAPGTSKPSSDPNGRNIQVDNPLPNSQCSTGAISPNEFPQGTVVPVTVTVTVG